MQKIPCLFIRKFDGPKVRVEITREVTPGCEWVLKGEGFASREWDGTACMVQNSMLYKRYTTKDGKLPPQGAVPCQPEPDAATGYMFYWILVNMRHPSNEHHAKGWSNYYSSYGTVPADGTYELIGPGVNANPEGSSQHLLVEHGSNRFDVPRGFYGLRDYLTHNRIKGIVFAHPDGRMCKIRRSDFGLDWASAVVIRR